LYSIIGHSKYINEHFEILFCEPFKISSSLPWVSILRKSGNGKFFFFTISSNVIVF